MAKQVKRREVKIACTSLENFIPDANLFSVKRYCCRGTS